MVPDRDRPVREKLVRLGLLSRANELQRTFRTAISGRPRVILHGTVLP